MPDQQPTRALPLNNAYAHSRGKQPTHPSQSPPSALRRPTQMTSLIAGDAARHQQRGTTWAGNFDCSACRRKRLVGAEFSKTDAAGEVPQGHDLSPQVQGVLPRGPGGRAEGGGGLERRRRGRRRRWRRWRRGRRVGRLVGWPWRGGGPRVLDVRRGPARRTMSVHRPPPSWCRLGWWSPHTRVPAHLRELCHVRGRPHPRHGRLCRPGFPVGPRTRMAVGATQGTNASDIIGKSKDTGKGAGKGSGRKGSRS